MELGNNGMQLALSRVVPVVSCIHGCGDIKAKAEVCCRKSKMLVATAISLATMTYIRLYHV